jgi:tripartite-type tricarboxylate transporter receptor subunit TctC
MNDLVGGQIPAGIDTTIELVEQHRAGKIRVLATAGSVRSPLFPDVPTMRELGFRDVEGSGWYAFYAPAATAASVVAELNRAIVAAAAMPDVKERLTKLGVDVQTSTPEDLARLGAADRAKWAPVIKASGFKGD